MKTIGNNLRIKRVAEMADYRRCVAIEKAVWGYTDSGDLVPLSMLSIINQSGGLLLAAYTPDRKIIGFVFGFPALKDGRLVHHSHMLAVLPGYRNTGIGRRLKLAQRRFVQRQGLDLITWTFDPLQALNAHFGIAKLGASVGRYKVNVYGESTSRLHRGLATDRFLAEWPVALEKSRRPANGLQPPADWTPIPVINETAREPSGFRRSAAPNVRRRELYLRFEIPADIEALKKTDRALAVDWQLKVRRAFLAYFRREYRVVDFMLIGCGRAARGFYGLACPAKT